MVCVLDPTPVRRTTGAKPDQMASVSSDRRATSPSAGLGGRYGYCENPPVIRSVPNGVKGALKPGGFNP
jgi:hypothetical protein